MLFDNNNDNLLSTFGKDSQSSNRKNSGVKQAVRNKHTCLNYFNDIKMQQKNKYEQILNDRKTLMLMQKKSQLSNNNYINNNKFTNNSKLNNKFNNNKASQLLRQKQESKKKLKTQSDIEYLNNKIRKSISGIAQTICKSKIHLESNKKLNQQQKQQKQQRQSTNNLHKQKQRQGYNQFFTTTNTRQFSSSSNNNKLLNDRLLKSSRYQDRYNINNNNNSDKQNISGLVNKNNNKYDGNNNKKNILRNSTKKKARFFSTTTQANDINNHFNNNNINNNQNHHNHKSHSRQYSNSSRLYTQPMSSNNWCSRFDIVNNNNNNSNRKQTNEHKQNQYRMSLQSQRQHKQQHQHYSQSSLNRLNKLKSQLNKQPNSKYNNNIYNNNNNSNRIQDTLKKQSKQLLMLVESNYIELPKLVDSSSNNNNCNNNSNRNTNNSNNNNHYSNKFTTHSTTMNSCNMNNNNNMNNNTIDNRDSDRNNHHYYFNNNNNDNNNRNFIHNRQPTLQSQHLLSEYQYQHQLNQQQHQQQQQQHQLQKSPNFNNITVPTKIFSLYDIKKNIQLYNEDTKRKHPLILALMQQIELDYDLRHAKHMFSGIEEPFGNKTNIIKGQSSSIIKSSSLSKWQLLNKQLTSRGLNYTVETIKKHFLPTEQQLDPFLSVTQPHDELIHSLIYAYETAQIHWQQTIYKKWQHWDLRDIQLTIENIDRDRKGYITVEDVAAFVSMQSGNQYKNRDVILMYKRLLCMGGGSQYDNNNNTCNTNSSSNSSNKSRLKFRSLIDCLIKGF